MFELRTIWSVLLATTMWLAMSVCETTQANAEIQGTTRTEYVNFRPTLIGNASWERLFISGLKGSATYRIDRPAQTPFYFAGNVNDLIVRNGWIWVDISFFAFTDERSTGVMRLVREPLSGTNDTIEIRITGEGYRSQRTDIVDFGRVNTGDTVRRFVWVPRTMADTEQWRVINFNQPAFVTSTPNGPVGFGDSVVFVFRFIPKRGGVYLDTVDLVRSQNGIDLDTLHAILVGNGIDFNIHQTINFTTIVTGDSATRSHVFLAPTPGNSKYRLEHRPARPFVSLLIGNSPLPWPPDSALIELAFVPNLKELYTDSIVITRLNLNDEILDTITIALIANGGGLPLESGGLMENVEIDKRSELTVEAFMDGKPKTRLFEYTFTELTSGPINGEFVAPVGPSLNQIITCGFSTTPTGFSDASQRWLLRRISVPQGIQWDSTIITVRQQMQPRPASFYLGWSTPSMRRRIGDTVDVNLVLRTNDPVDVPFSFDNISGSVIFNSTVIVPLIDQGIERIVLDDQARVSFRFLGPISVSSNATVVGTLRFVVVLGDTDRTPLTMQRVQIVRGQGNPEDIPGTDAEVIVTNIWRYGQGAGRFVNPTVGNLVMEIDPNPIFSHGMLRVSNVPTGTGTLQVIDAMGQIVADLTRDLRAGIKSWSISNDEGGVLALAPGSYYARLTSQGATSQTLYSLVRLFVVQ